MSLTHVRTGHLVRECHTQCHTWARSVTLSVTCHVLSWNPDTEMTLFRKQTLLGALNLTLIVFILWFLTTLIEIDSDSDSEEPVTVAAVVSHSGSIHLQNVTRNNDQRLPRSPHCRFRVPTLQRKVQNTWWLSYGKVLQCSNFNFDTPGNYSLVIQYFIFIFVWSCSAIFTLQKNV